MPQPQLAQERCVEREEIVESIRAVMGRIISLNNAEREALKRHDFRELERIDGALARESASESFLLEKLQAHLQSHRSAT